MRLIFLKVGELFLLLKLISVEQFATLILSIRKTCSVVKEIAGILTLPTELSVSLTSNKYFVLGSSVVVSILTVFDPFVAIS